MIMIVFAYIICSPVNVLQVSPLFFLGSTLIFIGYDLLYEWLWEIRHQVFLSEYGIVWFTFIIIQMVGIDAGIILGILIAILDQVVMSAKTSGINRVSKTSRAVWTPADAKILHDHAYHPVGPKIVTLEVIGTIFFGSSLNILTRMNDEIGLSGEGEDVVGSPIHTPHTSSHLLTLDRKPSSVRDKGKSLQRRTPPKYLVLDLMAVSHLDASATRGCFLQLVKMCAKRDILVCASGMTPRIEWMFRSHGVSIDTEEEEDAVHARLLSRENYSKPSSLESILLFVTVQEALEFCETALIHRFDLRKSSPSLARISDTAEQPLSRVLIHILGASEEEKETLRRLDNDRYHEEKAYNSGDMIFQKNTHSDSFYIVLQGSIANATTSSTASDRQKQPVMSGAGLIQNQQRSSSSSNIFDLGFQEQSNKTKTSVATLWHVGSVFGYLGKLVEDAYGKTSLTEWLTLVSGSFQITCWSDQEVSKRWWHWMERKWLNLHILI
jgi:anti-anti-sigma regulatory factor